MNKRILIIGALVTVLAVAAVLVVNREGNFGNQDDAIKIGAILPLTGDAAQYGQADKEGILLAVEEANRAGGVSGRPIQALFEDSKTDPRLAIAGFNRLRSQGVVALIDNAISTLSLALVPLLEPAQAVLISTGASNPALSGASPYFFRVWNSDVYEGRVTSDFIDDRFPTGNIAVLHINSDYGKGLLNVIAQKLGSRIGIVDTFEKDTRDFRQIISKVIISNPAIVYIVGYAPQTGPLVRQLRETGNTSQIIGTVAMEDPEFLTLAGLSSEGVIYPFPKEPEGDAVETFKTKFRAKYGKHPGLLHDVSFDAANLLIGALRSGAVNGSEIRDYLSKFRNYQGASGAISFDENGDVSKPMEMRVIRNSTFLPYSGN